MPGSKKGERPSQARLREIMDYDLMTGEFRNRVMRGAHPVGALLGSIHHSGYRHIRVDGRKYQASHLAWVYAHGYWPPVKVDHRDLVRSNDRLANLRLADNSGNGANRPACASNTTGRKGVTFRIGRHYPTGIYAACIRKNGRTKHLGHFRTLEEAAEAYRIAAVSLHGEFARF